MPSVSLVVLPHIPCGRHAALARRLAQSPVPGLGPAWGCGSTSARRMGAPAVSGSGTSPVGSSAKTFAPQFSPGRTVATHRPALRLRSGSSAARAPSASLWVPPRDGGDLAARLCAMNGQRRLLRRAQGRPVGKGMAIFARGGPRKTVSLWPHGPKRRPATLHAAPAHRVPRSRRRCPICCRPAYRPYPDRRLCTLSPHGCVLFYVIALVHTDHRAQVHLGPACPVMAARGRDDAGGGTSVWTSRAAASSSGKGNVVTPFGESQRVGHIAVTVSVLELI